MNPPIFHYLALALTLIGLVAALVMVIIAVISLGRARTGQYYVVREQSRIRGLRLLAMAILVLLATLGPSALLNRWASRPVAVVQKTATPAATSTAPRPTLTFTPVSTLTPEPPTETPQPHPTATPLPVPTATASPTRIPPTDLPPSLLTPVPSAVPAEDNASFGPIQFGAGYVNFQLTGVAEAFLLDTRVVHATFLVRNLNRGAPWTAAWYRDGKYVAGDPLLWDAAPNTIAHVYFGPQGGYRAGKWELRLYIEDRLQQKATFTIRNVTATPTVTLSPTATATPAE